MPPNISKTALSSLSRNRCTATSIPIRSFSASSAVCTIGPENPGFIEVPVPPQAQAKVKQDIKGTLPPPRDIFGRQGGFKHFQALAPRTNKQISREEREEQSKYDILEYASKAAPAPKSESEPANDFVAWKQRMAASRRENLQIGLMELHERKMETEKQLAKRRRYQKLRVEKLRAEPQREDERLTSPTIKEATKILQTGAVVPDPRRNARLQSSAAKVKAKALAREQARRDALHNLYMHAREFIVTEKQLDDEIEKIFTDRPHGPNDERSNIWEVLGAPITVQNMLSEVNNTQKTAMRFHDKGFHKASERMKRIAEELTGGKMD